MVMLVHAIARAEICRTISQSRTYGVTMADLLKHLRHKIAILFPVLLNASILRVELLH